jgi:S1-C subfamily serine protease
VDADGPAGAAGLLLGDVLLTANDVVLETPDDLLNLLGPTMVGRTIRLEIVRGGSPTTAELLVGERPRKRA